MSLARTLVRRLVSGFVGLAVLATFGSADAAAARTGSAGHEAAPADTVEVVRYATLGQAVAATAAHGAKLVAADDDPADNFGWSVSLDGDRALVGAYRDDEAGANAGAAYVFAYDAGQPPGRQWSQEAKLIASDAAPGDRLGESVSLSGDRALVGAADHEPAGAAYVFVYDAGQPPGQQWVEEAKLTGDGLVVGNAVALNGDRALVSASLGVALVFQRDDGGWTPEAELTADDGSPGLGFGSSLALDGGRALVGAQAFVGGAAYVFAFDGAGWGQEAKLTAAAPAEPWQFGRSVALSGDRALVGSRLDESPPAFINGAAYVYAFDGTSWRQEAQLTPNDSAPFDLFGYSVSLSGERALIGAPTETDDPSDPNANEPGSAYVFALADGAWTQRAKLTPGDGAARDEFGVAVSLSGDRALVGAHQDDDGGPLSGSAYVFDLGFGAPLVADAGPDQTVVAGQTAALDGSGSSGDGPLGFAWTLTGAALSGAGTATPSFCAAAPGTYAATLTVTDGSGDADADAVTVTALSPTDALSALVADVVATPGPRGPKRLLVSELKKAQRALARGADPSPFLDAFRQQVQDLAAIDALPPDAAAALVASADAVSVAVASPCSELAVPALASADAARSASGFSAFPNPTTGRVTVAFTVEAAGAVRLSVVDALGREVAVLAEGAVEAGAHRAELDGSGWPAGVYLVRLATADGRVVTRRLTRL